MSYCLGVMYDECFFFIFMSLDNESCLSMPIRGSLIDNSNIIQIIFAFSERCSLSAYLEASLANNSTISFSIASFNFFDPVLGSERFNISTRYLIYSSCSVNACLVFISSFKSPSLVFDGMGHTDEMLSCFTFMLPATDIIFLLVNITVIVTSYLFECSLNTMNSSPGSIRYLVTGDLFNCSAVKILYSSRMVSSTVLAMLTSWIYLLFLYLSLMTYDILRGHWMLIMMGLVRWVP